MGAVPFEQTNSFVTSLSDEHTTLTIKGSSVAVVVSSVKIGVVTPTNSYWLVFAVIPNQCIL